MVPKKSVLPCFVLWAVLFFCESYSQPSRTFYGAYQRYFGSIENDYDYSGPLLFSSDNFGLDAINYRLVRISSTKRPTTKKLATITKKHGTATTKPKSNHEEISDSRLREYVYEDDDLSTSDIRKMVAYYNYDREHEGTTTKIASTKKGTTKRESLDAGEKTTPKKGLSSTKATTKRESLDAEEKTTPKKGLSTAKATTKKESSTPSIKRTTTERDGPKATTKKEATTKKSTTPRKKPRTSTKASTSKLHAISKATTARSKIVALHRVRLTNAAVVAKCQQFGFRYPHLLCLGASPDFIRFDPIHSDLAVHAHNYWRSNFINPLPNRPLGGLIWNDDLATLAGGWASQCRFEHSDPANRRLSGFTNIGENICTSNNDYDTFIDCIDNWAYQRFNWMYGMGQVDSGFSVSAYTQLVRQETRAFGCARARCQLNEYRYITVCAYDVGGDDLPRDSKDPVSQPFDAMLHVLPPLSQT